MRLLTLFILLLTLSLYADPSVESNIVLDQESYSHAHESVYGVTNNYAVVSVAHQIKADGCLLFYYGTRLGLVMEDYAAQNGFGPDAEAYGLVMQANVGVDYLLQDYQTLSFEGSHSENKMIHDAESQVKFQYQLEF